MYFFVRLKFSNHSLKFKYTIIEEVKHEKIQTKQKKITQIKYNYIRMKEKKQGIVFVKNNIDEK